MKKDITARLKNVLGQLEGILRLREDEASCEQQLIQLKAIRAGVSAVMQKIIEEELASCSKVSEREQVMAKLVVELISHN
jgi:DNA-binding FrmR family transcriptional regulator